MPIIFTIRKGSSESLNSDNLILPEGGLAYTTDTKKLYVSDGTNKFLVGGVEQGLLSERPATGDEGEIYYATDTGESFYWNGSSWTKTNVTNLSELNGTLDDISDGTNYQKIAATDVDVNGHITTIYKDGTPISATDIDNKADKVSSATIGNLTTLDAEGNLVDSGSAPSDFLTSTDLTTKADKVSGATDGNLAGLNATGNLTDSGISPTTISNKADKVSGATIGNITTLDAEGNLVDSGSAPSDFLTSTDLTTKADKVISAVDGNIATLNASGNLTDSGISPTTINNKADKVSGATNGNLAGLDATGNLTDSGNNATDFIADTADSVDFLNLQSTTKQIQVDFVIQGTFMDSRTIGEDLLQTVNKHIFKWQLANATLIGATSVVLLDDSSSAASINIEINGVAALSSNLSLLETDTSGTINTSNDDILTGDRVEITVANTGGASDSEDLTLRTVWQF